MFRYISPQTNSKTEHALLNFNSDKNYQHYKYASMIHQVLFYLFNWKME